ncbi:MAG: ribosomal protein S5-alanine N-acetyltransferase [Leptolyngbyaceae cyanobacterium RU_5_1]|nr:ribosomal protein S5-alanine N-acetyltransferase [Leptolyngbyaceae cyanobacterium RU_5_1]
MNLDLPLIKTERLILRLATQKDVAAILTYYSENRHFLTPFEPARPKDFYTIEFWKEQVEKALIEFNFDQTLKLCMFKRTSPDQVIGKINFNQIQRGIAHYCVLGYNLTEHEQGNGYMTEALKAAIQHMFNELNLHRIMANYMPHNQRSGNLLKRLGFVVEGYARDYLLINGKWEDHILTSLTNPAWKPNQLHHPL